MGTGAGIVNTIKTPLAAVLLLIVCLVLAGLTIAASVSGDLTAAAVSAAGFVVIILILAMINALGRGG